MFKRMLQHPVTIRILAQILSSYGRFVYATARIRVVTDIPAQVTSGAIVMAVWHQQICGLPLLRRAVPGPVLALMSASRDGRFMNAVAKPFQIGSIAGSSHRGPVPAVRQLIRAARQGYSLSITPDGPRGPARVAKAGATEVAQLTGLPLIPCAAWARHAITFGSWDELRLPLPFTTITLAYGAPLAALNTQALGAVLDALTAQAQEAARRVDSPGATA